MDAQVFTPSVRLAFHAPFAAKRPCTRIHLEALAAAAAKNPKIKARFLER